MRIRIETRRSNQEVESLKRTFAGIELIRRRSSSTLKFWINVGVVSVDVTTTSVTTDNNDSAVAESFSGRIPTLLLHRKNGSIVEPLTIRVVDEIIVVEITGTENTKSLGTIVVAIYRIVKSGVPSWFEDITDVAGRADGTVSTKGHIGTVGQMVA